MKSPKFSVVTSTYNQLESLKKLKKALEAQTFQDFEWIIASDGSTDGTYEWAQDNNIKIYHKDKNTGYDFVGVLNNADELCEGEYIVWIMGDSWPTIGFLDQINKVVGHDRLVTGVRYNIEDGKIHSPEWRVQGRPEMIAEDEWDVTNYPRPWEYMTLNSMCMPAKKFREMGGIYSEYKGYGQMDWDMAAWAYYNGMKLVWANRAILNHLWHTEREDTPDNVEIFKKRLNYLSIKNHGERKRT